MKNFVSWSQHRCWTPRCPLQVVVGLSPLSQCSFCIHSTMQEVFHLSASLFGVGSNGSTVGTIRGYPTWHVVSRMVIQMLIVLRQRHQRGSFIWPSQQWYRFLYHLVHSQNCNDEQRRERKRSLFPVWHYTSVILKECNSRSQSTSKQ